MTYACTGPCWTCTVVGVVSVVHALLNTAELAMSGTMPPAGGVHDHGTSDVVHRSPPLGSFLDGMYDMFIVIGVRLKIAWMFEHDPLVKNTIVIGLPVLSRS